MKNKVKLGDLVNIKTGKLDANAANNNGKYPFFTTSEETFKIDTYAYDDEAVLVAGNGNLNVKYFYGKFNAYQRTYILTKKENIKVNIKYIYYFLDKYLETLRSVSIGGVIKYIKLENLINPVLDLPTIEIQNKIVKKLDTLKEVLDMYEKKINLLSNFNKSLFTTMFGNIKTNDKNWEILEIKEVSNILTRGKTPKYTSLSNIFIINQACVYWDRIKYENIKFHLEEENLLFLKNKDILINSTGTGTLGRMNIIKNIINEKFTIDSHVMLLRLKKEKVLPIYFINIFMGEQYQKELLLKCVNGSTNQIELSKEKFSKFKIPVPPIELQNKFAERIEKIEKLKFIRKNKKVSA